ncbi:MAG: tRNA 2-thiouridine(34) synthase MnmA [Burkholderiaceae bacterium]
MSGSRIVVGLSGGVDSAVAAWLLKQQGHDVVGLFMKNWEDDDDDEYCSTREDLIDATSVADVIGIDIEAVNFSTEYKDRVFSAFLTEYSAGRTPNPDVLCNAEIKFKAFLDHALRLGADHIATGHYARIGHDGDGLVQLLKATDTTKDQSYFLHRLTQAQLSRALFPLGAMRKTDVRLLAEQIGLPNARKKDSTGICFIGERPFREFLNRYLPTQPGPIRTPDGSPDGQRIGTHVGLAFYTLGQRKGIGIGGVKSDVSDSEGAWFVAKKNMADNTLWVVRGHDHPWLLSLIVEVAGASWIAGTSPADGCAVTAKTRYRQADEGCTFAADGAAFRLTFERPQRAVTPGQSAVLYEGDVCLGGGIIDGSTAGTGFETAPAQQREPALS